MLSERRGVINLHNLFESLMTSKSFRSEKDEVVVVSSSNLTQLAVKLQLCIRELLLMKDFRTKTAGNSPKAFIIIIIIIIVGQHSHMSLPSPPPSSGSLVLQQGLQLTFWRMTFAELQSTLQFN